MKHPSPYGMKKHVKALREEYANLWNISFFEIDSYFETFLLKLPKDRQPQGANERRMIESEWLKTQIETARVVRRRA